MQCMKTDPTAPWRLALERDHVLEARAGWDGDQRVALASILVADVLDEQQHKDVVLVLTRVHPTAQFIAR